MRIKYLIFIPSLVTGLLDYKLPFDGLEWLKHYIEISFQPGAPSIAKRLAILIDHGIPSILKSSATIIHQPRPQILDPPMYVKHGTPEESRLYLNNSLTANCFDNSYKEERCMCSKVYSDIEVVYDKVGTGTVIISANNRFKQIVISFPATASTENFIDDLDFVLIDLPEAPEGAKLHGGFYRLFLSTYHGMKRALIKKLQDPKYKDYVVHITGYSLGGGVAVVAIPDVYKIVKAVDPTRKIQVFNYMSPRPGNLGYARYIASFDIPITRHTYGNDWIPHLSERGTGAVHVGQEIYTPKDTHETIICSQKYDEDPNCADRFDLIGYEISSHLRPFGTKFHYPPYC